MFFDGITLLQRGKAGAQAKDLVSTYLRVNAIFKQHTRLLEEFEEVQEEQSQIDAMVGRIQSLLMEVIEECLDTVSTTRAFDTQITADRVTDKLDTDNAKPPSKFEDFTDCNETFERYLRSD